MSAGKRPGTGVGVSTCQGRARGADADPNRLKVWLKKNSAGFRFPSLRFEFGAVPAT